VYKLVIAEDEERLRKGLINFINWSELGFEVVAAFGDGKDVIDYLVRNHVDAVFTDIQMADVSGLEVAKFVYEEHQDCKVIVISGFKEFGYARQAIEYKVEHYLIKPIDIDEIARVFTELKRKLDRKQQLEQSTLKDRELAEEIFPFLQEQLFIDLAIGAILSDQELDRRLRLAGMDIRPDASSALSSIYVSDYDSGSVPDNDQLHLALAKLLREQTGTILHHIIFTQQYQFKILSVALEGQSVMELERQLKQQMTSIRDTLNDFFGITATVHNEGCCRHLFDVGSMFRKSIGDNREQPFRFNYMIEKFKLVLSKLNDGADDSAASIWASYMREISQLSADKQHNLFAGLFPAISEYAHLNGIETGVDVQSPLSPLSSQTGQRLLGKLFDGVAANPQKSSNIMIEKAKLYIETNYHQDLSLDDVAAQVFLHPIYFSRFFKRETGERFIDYITQLRMNKAIELLIENKYKVYEISAMVGYRSDKYFAKLFKQHTGYSPRDYLKYIMKISEDQDD
jgi:two-component system response regulator YesN